MYYSLHHTGTWTRGWVPYENLKILNPVKLIPALGVLGLPLKSNVPVSLPIVPSFCSAVQPNWGDAWTSFELTLLPQLTELGWIHSICFCKSWLKWLVHAAWKSSLYPEWSSYVHICLAFTRLWALFVWILWLFCFRVLVFKRCFPKSICRFKVIKNNKGEKERKGEIERERERYAELRPKKKKRP